MNDRPLCFDCRVPLIHSARYETFRCTKCRAETSEHTFRKLGWKPVLQGESPLARGNRDSAMVGSMPEVRGSNDPGGYGAEADLFGVANVNSRVEMSSGGFGVPAPAIHHRQQITSVLTRSVNGVPAVPPDPGPIDPIDGEPLPPELLWLLGGIID